MARAAATITVLLLATLAIAPVAPARIDVQRGIAGAELGMTRAQVLRRLGKPRRVLTDRTSGALEIGLVYPTVFVALYGGARVTTVMTTSPSERTTRAVGVGSTAREVAARVPGARCVRTPGGQPYCSVGSLRPGAVLTWFVFKDGRVFHVGVTRVNG